MKFLCIFLIFGTAVALSSVGRAQHHHVIEATGAPILMPGGIDGSKTPELITDRVAFMLFMNAVAEPAEAPEADRNRAKAKLSRAQLSSSDLEKVLAIFSGYLSKRQALEQQYGQAAVTGKAGSIPERDFSGERFTLVDATTTTLGTSISPEGYARLLELVRSEKRRMFVAPFPTMQ